MEEAIYEPNSGRTHLKWKTYSLTFSAYVALHTMRMSYSQVKSDFQAAFDLSNLFLGILDACVYIALSCGFFFRFLLQGSKTIIKTYLVFITVACIAYSVIPISSLLLGEQLKISKIFRFFMPAACLLLFGFFQFPAWPTLLTITSEHFNLRQEGKELGFWSANGDVGNIVGFALSGILVNSLGFGWETAMILAAIFNFCMARWVYRFILQTQKAARESKVGSLLDQQENSSAFHSFLQYSARIVQLPENRLYLFSMGLLKSILYGFLLWMPTYLAHNNLKQYKSPTLITFNFGTLLGSVVLGMSYERLKERQSLTGSVQSHLIKHSLCYSCVGIIVSLTLFYITPFNATFYIILSLLCGAFLGGCFNMLASNEVLSITRGVQEEVNMLSTLSMFVGNFMVGIVQIVIGVILDIKNDPQGQNKLFMILVVIGCISLVVLFKRSQIMLKVEKGEINEFQLRAIRDQ